MIDDKKTASVATIEEELLLVHVDLEKLKLARKSILKTTAIIGFIGLAIILFGLYGQYAEWIEYPIIPFLIFVGGVFIAVALRPVQQYKKDWETTEKKRLSLGNKLKKENLGYTATVQITEDVNGELDIKKSIKIITPS